MQRTMDKYLKNFNDFLLSFFYIKDLLFLCFLVGFFTFCLVLVLFLAKIPFMFFGSLFHLPFRNETEDSLQYQEDTTVY